MEPKTTTIQHPEQGRVEGVTYKKIELLDPKAQAIFHGDYAVEGWMSQDNGCFYLKSGGWREVPVKRDVTGEVELEKNDDGWTIFRLNEKDADMSPDVTFTKAQGVVIPAGMTWRDFWFQFWADTDTDEPPESPERVCERMATTVIQVWKEGE